MAMEFTSIFLLVDVIHGVTFWCGGFFGGRSRPACAGSESGKHVCPPPSENHQVHNQIGIEFDSVFLLR